MPQQFKSVYYQDYPASTPDRKHVKLAFGQKDFDLYQAISPLSSDELRNLLGYGNFKELKRAAENEYLPLSTFCLRKLRQCTESRTAETPATYMGHLFLDPIQATFRGGESEPLHSWYPFLEGYSPKYVEGIINCFAPHAQRVLDPFSGTGTTPLTVARLGLEAFFCELNPLLQYLTDAKVDVLNFTERTRSKLIPKLQELIPILPDGVKNCNPDHNLLEAYTNIFGKSQFFDEDIFDLILRARTYIDSVACTDCAIANLLTVAVLSSLIPASRLIRAGDLRFKRPEESRKEFVGFLPYVQNQLSRIVEDLLQLEPIHTRPILLCEDARNIDSLPQLELDTIITSPPYLNGTNYFRNTKIELWFLRCLRTAMDLTLFRLKAVTAGINDVIQNKNGHEPHEKIATVVKELERHAYDKRIPRMVESYFEDIGTIFRGVRKHLVPGAIIAIDIGDSTYAGVRVPTDELLVTLLAEYGYKFRDKIRLRQRLSRSGVHLYQVLLIFSYPRQKTKRRSALEYGKNKWCPDWINFKNNLPHQKPPYSKRNWGHPLHSLCSYQGKMKPSLASFLVRTFLRKPSTVLDPFAGVGTIPFEAALFGHKAYGFEISPVARIIATAKLGRPDLQSCQQIIEDLEIFIDKNSVTHAELETASRINFNRSILDYYHERTLREILLARRFFLQKRPTTDSECLVAACLLHILHGNRPYALSRRSHPITPFAPTGKSEYRPLLPRLKEKVMRSLNLEYPDHFVKGKIFHQDATSWWPQEVDALDAIITSPPFFDSTRFHLANWLRLWFCGWELEDFESKPLAFVDERQKLSFSVYESVFRQSKERLKPGGVMVLHLGKSNKCDMGIKLASVARRWFNVVDSFSESVTHCESHGIRDKGTVYEHQFLILQ